MSIRREILCSASQDGSIQAWNMEQKRKLFDQQHPRTVHCILISGIYLISSGMDGTVRLWSIPNGDEVRKLRFNQLCSNFDMTRDRTRIAISHGSSVDLRSFQDNDQVKKFDFENWVNDVRFNRSGDKVAVGLLSGEVFLIEML